MQTEFFSSPNWGHFCWIFLLKVDMEALYRTYLKYSHIWMGLEDTYVVSVFWLIAFWEVICVKFSSLLAYCELDNYYPGAPFNN